VLTSNIEHQLSNLKRWYDVVILGAGHNGLVAASYLGRAGLRILMLEKNDYIGGATTSQKLFPDYDARLSRYSYLVSLFPEKIIRDLGLNLEWRRRATGSFTPYQKDGVNDGLLLSNVEEAQSRKSMADLTGSDAEYEQMKKLYNLSRVFAEHAWDSMLEPLVAKDEFKRRFDVDDVSREAWRSLAEEPLGRAIERYLKNDLVRGLVLTDGKIGLLTYPHDPSLVQNRCFLYHLIGNKTGEWKVPVGGMGAVARELEQSARKAGAEMLMKVHGGGGISVGELRPEHSGEVLGRSLPAGGDRRRLRFQDQHAFKPVAKIEIEETCSGVRVVRHISHR
jgi:phytoene dehydrogenase-like protein